MLRVQSRSVKTRENLSLSPFWSCAKIKAVTEKRNRLKVTGNYESVGHIAKADAGGEISECRQYGQIPPHHSAFLFKL